MELFTFYGSRPQSVEDKIGEEMTKSLKRMLETMRSEVERSSANISTATSTTKHLKGTTENYENLSGTLEESRGLIRDLWKRNRNDMIYIIGALGVFVATVVYVIVQRTPGVVWLPGKLIVGQLANLIPKSREIVDKITEMTEAVLSDAEEMEEPPGMFIDTIEKEPQEEYGSDELLKNDDQIERSEPDMKNEQNAPSEHDHQVAIDAAKEVESDKPPVELGESDKPAVELVESDKPTVEAISVAKPEAAPSISIDEAVQSAAVEASNETNSSTDPVDDSDTQIPLNTLEALEEFITPTIEINAVAEIPEHLIATTSVTEIIEPTVASASIDGEVKPETVPGPIDRPKETGVTATSTTAADDSTSASTLHLADADESESDGDNEYYSDGESNSDTELKLEL